MDETNKERFVLQQQGSILFGKGTDTPYISFLFKDPYYQDCARVLADRVYTLRRRKDGHGVDVGSGCGGSAVVFIDYHDRLTCVEPEDELRKWIPIHFPNNPRVVSIEGRAENLSDVVEDSADVVYLCNVFPHLKGKEEKSIEEISKILDYRGFCAFDFGPSNYEYKNLKISDFRKGKPGEGEIMSELGHPLQHLFYKKLESRVKRALAECGIDYEGDLWPPEKARASRKELTDLFGDYGMDLSVTEELMPISGKRIKNFLIFGGRLVFFRKYPMNEIPEEVRGNIVNQALEETFDDFLFKEFENIDAYHPMAVCIAQKIRK